MDPVTLSEIRGFWRTSSVCESGGGRSLRPDRLGDEQHMLLVVRGGRACAGTIRPPHCSPDSRAMVAEPEVACPRVKSSSPAKDESWDGDLLSGKALRAGGLPTISYAQEVQAAANQGRATLPFTSKPKQSYLGTCRRSCIMSVVRSVNSKGSKECSATGTFDSCTPVTILRIHGVQPTRALRGVVRAAYAD